MYEDYQAPRYNDEQPQGDSGMFGRFLRGASNLADVPGSMVRDAISLQNPFDQLMSPFSDENRTTGAQMSRAMFGGDENSGGNQLAGMIVDILSDPLMIASGGSLAAGKMGLKGAKAAMNAGKRVGGVAKAGFQGEKAAVAGERAAKVGPKVQQSKRLMDKAQAQKGAAQDALFEYQPKGMEGYQQAMDQIGSANRNMDRISDATRSVTTPSMFERMMSMARPAGMGAAQGARQFGSEAYSGVGNALQTGMQAARNNLGGVMRGDRNAMMQLGAVAPNMGRTMMGERRSQEPSIEELIAQLMMEDPSMMESY